MPVNGTVVRLHPTKVITTWLMFLVSPTYKAEEKGGFDKVWTEWTLTFKIHEDADDPDDWEYVTATIRD